MSDDGKKKLSKANDDPLNSSSSDPNKKEWVKFEEEEDDVTVVAPNEQGSASVSSRTTTNGPAVLSTESIHVTIETAPKTKDGSNDNKSSPPASKTLVMRNVELTTERITQGFVNGEVIVTLLPVNTSLPWITSATFRPELVPEELMAEGLTLTVEEYVQAMETLVNDYRFTMYNMCYKRVLMCWITLAFGVLLGLLFSGITGILLFSLGVSWLFLNAVAIFVCMWAKMGLARGLEKCLARVNKMLMKHKIVIALDDRGNISCHKIHLCFIYFDSSQCVTFINSFLERSEHNGQTVEAGWETRLDIDATDIVIQGSSSSNNKRVSRKQEIAEHLILRYMQRWAKDLLRRRLEWQLTEDGPAAHPRHLAKTYCLCQYVEEILLAKIPKVQKDEAKSSCFSCCGCGSSSVNQKNHGELVVLRYVSRWGKELLRKYLSLSIDNPGRHMLGSICPCQFIETHLKCKPKGNYCLCCPQFSEHNYMYPY